MSGPCFSASVGGHPLRPPTRRRLGRPLPYQQADGSQVPPKVPALQATTSFLHGSLTPVNSWGISSPFELLSPSSGQVTNALLTRSPLRHYIAITSPFDLHVLGTPPAFILSQDQTLRKNVSYLAIRKGHGVKLEITGFAFYHSSVVKVLPMKRAGFYQPWLGLSRANLCRTETRLPMPSPSSTSAHFLVSHTETFY